MFSTGMMNNEMPGTSKDVRGRILRPRRTLNPAQIAALVHELDVSDLELSDDDEIADKTFIPTDNPELDDEDDDDDLEQATEEAAELLDETLMSSGQRTRWKLDENFGSDFTSKSNDTNNPVKSPINYLEEYLPDSIFETITRCTNQRGLIVGKSFNLKIEEIKKFIGLSLYMSVMRAPWLRLHWNRRYGNSIVASTMTRDRFFLIRANIKVVDDNTVSDQARKEDKLWKIRPILDCVLKRCVALKRPDTVCIDEQMIPFTGTSELKQYVPNKPNPEGLKNWVLATTEGLVLDFEVSQGKDHLLKQLSEADSSTSPGNGEAVVLRLIQTLEEGTRVYFDRYFTTISLTDKMSLKGLKCTGTIQRNRVPKQCREKLDLINLHKQPRGSAATIVRTDRSDQPLGITGWYDNKVITLASNHEGIKPNDHCKRWSKRERKYIQVERPLVVKHYNDFMGGIDLCDRMIALYRIRNRSRKWTVRTILHFIDLSVANSWAEYKTDCKENNVPCKNILQFLEFKLNVADKLMNATASETNSSTSGDESERPSVRVPLPDPKRRKTCAKHMPKMTSGTEPYHKCRLPNCSKLSRTSYESCGVFLCLNTSRNCFAKFHK